MILSSLHNLFSSKLRIFAYSTLVLIFGLIWWIFTDTGNMFGSYGPLHTGIDIGLSFFIIIGFPLFLIAFFYRAWRFGKKTSIQGTSSIGLISGIIGTIISGASCCGLTLAIYFGLMPLMTLLPYDGLEVKFIATLGLLYGLFDILKKGDSCNIKKTIKK